MDIKNDDSYILNESRSTRVPARTFGYPISQNVYEYMEMADELSKKERSLSMFFCGHFIPLDELVEDLDSL